MEERQKQQNETEEELRLLQKQAKFILRNPYQSFRHGLPATKKLFLPSRGSTTPGAKC